MLSAVDLFGILIVSCLMSVAILGSLLRTTVAGVGRWCFAYALLAAASSWVLLVGNQPGPGAIMSILLITLGAVMLLVQGMRQFFGLSPVRRDESVVAVVVVVTLAYFTYVSPDPHARVTLASIVFAYGRITVGTLALRHAPRDGTRYAHRFLAAAAYLGALVHIARVVASATGVMPPTTFLQLSLWNVLLLGLAVVTLPCMSIGMVMLAHDQLALRMEKLATIDELTGVLMRRAFMSRANLLLSEAQEKTRPLSIAILDVDNFKAVNDGFGHAVGDRVLARVASVVSRELRSCDLLGRLGGEEFAILFADTRKADAARLANALRLAVERSPDDGVRCTFSAGVSAIVPGDTLESAIVRADAALYMAKAAGRNRVVVAPETDELDALAVVRAPER